MTDFQIRSDHVDVEQIMRQIRARIREKRGVDYTEEEIRALVERCLTTFEGVIRLYPDQWFVFAPLWKGEGAG